jgi:MFS family permease
VGTAGLLLALNRGESWGWMSWPTLGLIIASGAMLGMWILHSLRIDHPLVDLHLAWGPNSLGANLTAVFAGVAVYMLLSLVMIAVQAPSADGFGLGRGVVAAGLLLVPYSLLNLLGSRLALALGRRMRIDLVLPIGCVLYGVAAATMAVFHQSFWQLLVGMALAGLGGGATFAVMPALLLRRLPMAETGSAVAFNMVLRFLGFSAGSALTPPLIEVFSGSRPPTRATFSAVAVVGVGLWVLALLIALSAARFAGRAPRPRADLI